MRACDVEAIGRPDTTLDDVRDQLREPEIDLESNAWVAQDDSNNVTPALRLYESVGMRQVLVIDGWRRISST